MACKSDSQQNARHGGIKVMPLLLMLGPFSDSLSRSADCYHTQEKDFYFVTARVMIVSKTLLLCKNWHVGVKVRVMQVLLLGESFTAGVPIVRRTLFV